MPIILYFCLIIIFSVASVSSLTYPQNLTQLVVSHKLTFSFLNDSQNSSIQQINNIQKPTEISHEIFMTVNLTDNYTQNQIVDDLYLYPQENILNETTRYSNYLIQIDLSPFVDCFELDEFYITNFKQAVEFYLSCINCGYIQSAECIQEEATKYQFNILIFSIDIENIEQVTKLIQDGGQKNYDKTFEIRVLEINGQDVLIENTTGILEQDDNFFYQNYNYNYNYDDYYNNQTLNYDQNYNQQYSNFPIDGFFQELQSRQQNETLYYQQNFETCPDSAYELISENCIVNNNQTKDDENGDVFVPESEVQIIESEIVGGLGVEASRYPYMMSLQVRTFPEGCFDAQCGGTLIAPDLVLTAAHCLLNLQGVDQENLETGVPEAEIFLARAPRCRHESGQSPRSKTIFQYIHPNFTVFDDGSFNFDIAILRLSESFPPPFVNIDASQTVKIQNEDVLSIIGYGAISDPDADPLGEGGVYVKNQLQLGRVKYINNKNCQDVVEEVYLVGRDTLTSEKLCADTFEQGIVDTCVGDSGGPIFVDGAGASQDIQVGITSYGFQYFDSYSEQNFACGGTSVYTRISEVIPWIYETLPEVQNIQQSLQLTTQTV